MIEYSTFTCALLCTIQWTLIMKGTDITNSRYNNIIFLVPNFKFTLYFYCLCNPDITKLCYNIIFLVPNFKFSLNFIVFVPRVLVYSWYSLVYLVYICIAKAKQTKPQKA